MNRILLFIITIGLSLSTQAQQVDQSLFCQTLGPQIITQQHSLVETREEQKILNGIEQNFNLICQDNLRSNNNQQLDIISTAIANGAGSSYFEAGMILMFIKGITTHEISTEELQEIFL